MVAVGALIWLSIDAGARPWRASRCRRARRPRRSTWALASCLRHARQLVLRQREDDGDGIELRDDHDAGRVTGVHHVAGVDLAHAGDAVDGRRDARVIELQARALDLRLVGLRRGVGLIDRPWR